MEKLVGRKEEQLQLQRLVESPKAEFVALYGRRRVGKTFLINHVFGGQFAFKMTGVIDGTLADQFTSFLDAMEYHGYTVSEKPKNWMEAFILLKKALCPRVESGERCIIFIDELPAMDCKNSGIAKAIGYFWNQWASLHSNIILIICGSATSWMISNIIDSKGGLHDRITLEMPIHPFCLNEVEEYLAENSFVWGRSMILQAYMIFGGIPYYLSLLDRRESLVQNVDRLFFGQDQKLRREYKRLFSTLYKNPEGYMSLVRALASSRQGMTRQEIATALKCANNGHLGDKLEDLVYCDLVRKIPVREKIIKKKDAIYQLVDFFSLFYLTFADRALLELDYWQHHVNTPELNTWLGLAYERVCMAHIAQIKSALGIDGISTMHYAWRSKSSNPGAQIDIVIERADMIVNLCEVKYSSLPYEMKNTEYEKIRNRMSAFQAETGMRHTPWLVMITTEGVKHNAYSSIIQGEITQDDLFK